jgi:hypothetical protein
VAAPSLIPRSAAGRLRKRDAVDAQILVQALRGGDLTRCARPPRHKTHNLLKLFRHGQKRRPEGQARSVRRL